MIRTVIFDIDNTLYDYDTRHEAGYLALGRYASGLYGISMEEYDALYRESMKQIRDRVGETAPVHSRAIRLQYFQQLLPGPHDFSEILNMYSAYWDAFLSDMKPFPDAIRFLGLLKEKNIRTGIGTDMTAHMQFKKLSLLGMDRYFDFVVTSEEAGEEKPGKKMFGLCLEKAGVPAGECMFIGDNPRKDIQGALSAGMYAVYLNTKGAASVPEEILSGSQKQRFTEITSYAELIDRWPEFT